MPNNKQITIFEGKKIRRIWDEKTKTWYFSIIDIVATLTNTRLTQKLAH